MCNLHVGGVTKGITGCGSLALTMAYKGDGIFATAVPISLPCHYWECRYDRALTQTIVACLVVESHEFIPQIDVGDCACAVTQPLDRQRRVLPWSLEWT